MGKSHKSCSLGSRVISLIKLSNDGTKILSVCMWNENETIQV